MEDRAKLPCLDEKGLDGERSYTYPRWLNRFKQYTKRKYEIDIGPKIKEETMTGTECNTKEETIQQNFLRALGPRATHQIARSEYRADPDKIKVENLIKLYKRYYIPKGNKYNSKRDFVWAKQTDMETPEDHWEKLFELEKKCYFPDFGTERNIKTLIETKLSSPERSR